MKHNKLYAPAAMKKLRRRIQKKRSSRAARVERKGYVHYRGCTQLDGWQWGTHPRTP